VIRDLTCGDPAGSAQIANSRSGNTRITACKSGIVGIGSVRSWQGFLMGFRCVWVTLDRGYLWNQDIDNLTSECASRVPQTD
jgi:hypothetical protein